MSARVPPPPPERVRRTGAVPLPTPVFTPVATQVCNNGGEYQAESSYYDEGEGGGYYEGEAEGGGYYEGEAEGGDYYEGEEGYYQGEAEGGYYDGTEEANHSTATNRAAPSQPPAPPPRAITQHEGMLRAQAPAAHRGIIDALLPPEELGLYLDEYAPATDAPTPAVADAPPPLPDRRSTPVRARPTPPIPIDAHVPAAAAAAPAMPLPAVVGPPPRPPAPAVVGPPPVVAAVGRGRGRGAPRGRGAAARGGAPRPMSTGTPSSSFAITNTRFDPLIEVCCGERCFAPYTMRCAADVC
jgi:hypothetical protein